MVVSLQRFVDRKGIVTVGARRDLPRQVEVHADIVTSPRHTAHRCPHDHGVVAWTSTRAKEPLPQASSRGSVRAADGVGPSGVQHTVEHGHADGRFGALARQTTRTQTRADDGLVATHGCLDERASAVALSFCQPSLPWAAIEAMCLSRCDGLCPAPSLRSRTSYSLKLTAAGLSCNRREQRRADGSRRGRRGQRQ